MSDSPNHKKSPKHPFPVQRRGRGTHARWVGNYLVNCRAYQTREQCSHGRRDSGFTLQELQSTSSGVMTSSLWMATSRQWLQWLQCGLVADERAVQIMSTPVWGRTTLVTWPLRLICNITAQSSCIYTHKRTRRNRRITQLKNFSNKPNTATDILPKSSRHWTNATDQRDIYRLLLPRSSLAAVRAE